MFEKFMELTFENLKHITESQSQSFPSEFADYLDNFENLETGDVCQSKFSSTRKISGL